MKNQYHGILWIQFIAHLSEAHQHIRLFLNSCEGPRQLKAASILDHYLENVKKVVAQNIHFIIDM